jgi:hypothetical protein
MGCGGNSDSSSGGAATASAVTTLPVEGAPFGDRIAAAGYQVVQFRRFPAQQPGRKAFAVVYRTGSSGGVLYTSAQGSSGDQPVWHWYFDDAAPDSATYLELNDDGLWDVRIYFGDKHRDFLQESDFSFYGKLRSDLIAVNGTASQQDGCGGPSTVIPPPPGLPAQTAAGWRCIRPWGCATACWCCSFTAEAAPRR